VRTVATLGLIAALIAAAGHAEAQILVGETAPDFTLPASTGGTISLSDFRGKNIVLVEFYHANYGPDCVENLKQRHKDYSHFTELGVVVLAISMDHTYSQTAFAASQGVPYPLLSDYPHGRTVEAYGVGHLEGEAGRLYARPSFFLIDKDGLIRGYWGQRPPNLDEVIAPDPLVSSRPMLEMAQALL